MKKLFLLLFTLLLSANSNSASAAEPEANSKPSVAVKTLSQADIDSLLKSRLNGGLGYTFSLYANQFFVGSALQLEKSVSLGSRSEKICEKRLMPVFPESYKPTLKELLDAIALQTNSDWKYNPVGDFVSVSKEPGGPPKKVEEKDGLDIAVFEFTESTDRQKPYSIEMAPGWASQDMGHWTKYNPGSTFPVGMDIYEMGTYSVDDAKDSGSLKQIPKQILSEWAKRIRQNPDVLGFQTVKVGPFDAKLFECELEGKSGEKLLWHNWAFMNGNRCYFILSAYPKELHDKIFPDVEKMLKSFKIK